MGNFEKLGILVIIILVVVILVLAVWGVGVPPEELFPGDSPRNLSAGASNGNNGEDSGTVPDVDLRPDPAPDPVPGPQDNIWPDPPPPEDLPALDPVVPPAPAPTYTDHVMKRGETVIELARHYYGSDRYFKRILAANPGLEPRSIREGTTLRIPKLDPGSNSGSNAPGPPSGRTYRVKKGDSLWVIARRHKVSVKELHEANRDVIGDDASSIVADMLLKIP